MRASPACGCRRAWARCRPPRSSSCATGSPRERRTISRAQLEAAIDEHPDDVDAYLVYADWLQEQLDPRAELIALHGATTPEARARKSSLERALAAKVGNCNQRWFYGFVWKVEWTLAPDQIDMLRRALEHPSWRHLTTVGFGMTEADEVLGVIAERPRPCWRSLTVNAHGAVDFDLWSVLPRITTVELKGSSISIGRPSPTLTSLKLDGELRFADLEPLLDGAAPNLQSLTLLRPLHPALLAGLVKSRIPSLSKLVLRHPGEVMARLLREVYPFATLIAPVG